jgi:hypothetical protein
MKRAAHPTDYIFIRASTASEWDSCDFAIIRLTDDWRKVMRKRFDLIQPFIDDDTFYSHHYWDYPQGFYVHDYEDEEETTLHLLNEDEDWAYIITDEKELASLRCPESRLDTYQLTVTKNGSANFSAMGKHSGEEYWTNHFGVDELVSEAELTGVDNIKS